ncbi:hypothetical protein ACWDXD_24710 [Streptomyces sp. NPDC003314]
MVKKHGKKQRAKNRSRRTGAAYASAAAGTTHKHEPLPDMSALDTVPGLPGLFVDKDLAARLVAACRAGCQPCQNTLTPKVVEDRATLLALAGAIYGTLPTAGPIAAAATQAWAPLARAAREDMGAAPDMLEAFAAMSAAQRSELLEDALDHWAMGGVSPDDLADMIKVITPEDLGLDAETVAAAVDPQTTVALYPDDVGGESAAGSAYRLRLGYVEMPDGRPLPLIAFEARTERAGLEHLRDTGRWQPWTGRGSDFPEMDFNWRIRMDIGPRTLREIVHTDRDGFDDIRLWRGEAKVPDDWWDLLDRASHALLCGPVPAADPDALLAAAAEGELVAVVGRARFM